MKRSTFLVTTASLVSAAGLSVLMVWPERAAEAQELPGQVEALPVEAEPVEVEADRPPVIAPVDLTNAQRQADRLGVRWIVDRSLASGGSARITIEDHPSVALVTGEEPVMRLLMRDLTPRPTPPTQTLI